MTKAGLSKMTKAGHSWLLNMKEKNYQVVKSPSELYPEKKIIKKYDLMPLEYLLYSFIPAFVNIEGSPSFVSCQSAQSTMKRNVPSLCLGKFALKVMMLELPNAPM